MDLKAGGRAAPQRPVAALSLAPDPGRCADDCGGTGGLRDTADPVPVGRAAVHPLAQDVAAARIVDLAGDPCGGQYVVTPNIAHIVELERDEEFRRAYAGATLTLPDGWPVAWAVGRQRGSHQSRVTGVDLMPMVCREAARRGVNVGFVGGQACAASRAAEAMRRAAPGLQVVLVEEAPPVALREPVARAALLAQIAAVRPGVLFLGLGAPKQEIFAFQHRPAAGVVVCVGAALDFAAGLRSRAPAGWQRCGLEWLYRLLHEPTRLGPRYMRSAPAFALLMLRQERARRVSGRSR